jgi:prevent-host-death family protein
MRPARRSRSESPGIHVIERLDTVGSCGHITAVKRKSARYPSKANQGSLLKETALEAEPKVVVNVRTAKNQLSSLLETAARGDEVVITSDGRPKAKLVPVQPRRRPFRMHWSWLRAQPLSAGPRAEALVREDRDSRP